MVGWKGDDTPGKEVLGTKHLVDLLLAPWKDDLKVEDGSPKVSMVFCKMVADIPKIDLALVRELKAYVDIHKCPWVTNYADIGVVHSQDITLMRDIKGWITSPMMQMGLDLQDVVYIILLRPPTDLEDFIQSWGRGGRMKEDGTTTRVICICLFNLEDISENTTGMTPEVRAFCLESGCLRKALQKVFGGGSLGQVDPEWCCGPCSGMNCLNPTTTTITAGQE